jgi:putative two-component system response regulator
MVNKLLFVDDEPNFLVAIKRLLRKNKDEWQCFFAESVQSALNLIAEERFDVILTDMNMPGMSGMDFLLTLQGNRETRSIPVIILTGMGDHELKRKALKNGATDLLNKPIEYEDLVARISCALRLKSYQDEIINHNITLEEKVQERTAELEFLHHDLIWRLAKAGELRDEETGDHVMRVAHYCRRISIALALTEKEINLIFATAPLHDLGKIGVPDGILLKQGPLNDFERSIMMQHCRVGAEILLEKPKHLPIKGFEQPLDKISFEINDELKQTAAAIALNHHEKWDGSGYPQGTKGSEIPLSGRITAFADVYDALRSHRPYKKIFSREKTWAIIEEDVGTHFDPDIFNEIKDMQDDFEQIRDQSLA